MTTLLSLSAITVAGYRSRTGDTETLASAVEESLDDAQRLLEEELRRFLALDERTETMRIHRHGRVYPKAYPITACATNTIEGRALLGALPTAFQVVVIVGVRPEARASITYTGGFDANTLPVTLAHALYDLAQGVILDRVPIPVGATSMSVGDVSVSGGASSSGGVDAYVQGLSARVGKYKNRFVA